MGIITVSRTHGSGGTAFAAELAKYLDYRFINRTILNNDCQGKNDHVCIFGLDEEGPSEFERNDRELLSNVDFYKVSLMANIIDRALKYNVVFAGMGAGIILSDTPEALNIRVVRLLSERVRAIALVKNIPYDDAFDLVERMDEGKRIYISQHFGMNVDDPTLYHLTINSSHIPMEDAVSFVVNHAERHFTGSRKTETENSLKRLLLEKRAEILLFRLGMAHSYGKVSFRASDNSTLTVRGTLRNEAEKDLLLENLRNNQEIKKIDADLQTGILPDGSL